MPDASLYAQLHDLAYSVVYHATRALLAFRQRESFLYWPFLVSTLLIAMLAWRIGYASGARGTSGVAPGWRAFFRRNFGAALWWHPSARVDYRYYLVNAVVFPLLLGPFLFGDRAVADGLDRLLSPFLSGAPVAAHGPGVLVTVLFTAAFFIAYDFGRFVAHSLLHDVPLLWEFHKVHHSAEVLTPITSFRAHPFDLALMAWVPALTTGILTWLFHRFVDAGIGFYTFLGLHILIWGFSLIGNLRHWQVWISYGATLNRWLISPAHHQLHHSAEPQHHGCNRGFELAVWDRLYGTLCVPANAPETFRMGLGDGSDGSWHTVARCYWWPFRSCARRWLWPAGGAGGKT